MKHPKTHITNHLPRSCDIVWAVGYECPGSQGKSCFGYTGTYIPILVRWAGHAFGVPTFPGLVGGSFEVRALWRIGRSLCGVRAYVLVCTGWADLYVRQDDVRVLARPRCQRSWHGAGDTIPRHKSASSVFAKIKYMNMPLPGSLYVGWQI